jgi:hypothetical protein
VELDNCTPSSVRKKRAYIVTAVDRTTHTIVGWAVVPERNEAMLQAVVDQAPQAQAYYSDGFATQKPGVWTSDLYRPAE